MKPRWSSSVFSVAFAIAYAGTFIANAPLFRYYPVPREWAWGAADAIVRTGPVITWYGLLAMATLVAVVAAIAVPDRWMMRACRGWLWAWPVAAVLTCLVLLRAFFL